MSAPNDLTSLADCKAWLGVTSTTDDNLLSGLISAISQAILADIGRSSILPSMVQETLDGGGETSIALRQWPVTQLISCAVAGLPLALATGPGQSGILVDAADPAPPGAMQRVIFKSGVFPIGQQAITIVYRAGYEIRSEMAIVPMAAPYVVSVQAPFGSWAVDTGIVGASTAYSVTAGIYTFGAADAGASVALSYGYVPRDLSRAACEWVADRYVARTRIGQSAKTLGGQETTSFIVKAMPDVVSRLLQPYRRVAR